MALLQGKGVEFTYRDYTREPLSVEELKDLFSLLDLSPRDLLRKRDKAYKELGLTGEEPDESLIEHISNHPTLLERPIGVLGRRAVVGRPPDKLLELLG